MLLKELYLSNLGRLDKIASLPEANIVWVCGKTGSGKTTALSSLHNLFCGCPTLEKTIGTSMIKAVVGFNGQTASYSVDVNENATVYKYNDMIVPKAQFDKMIPFDRELMKYCLDPLRLDEHDEKFQKKIISKLTGSDVNTGLTEEEAKKEYDILRKENWSKVLEAAKRRKDKMVKLEKKISDKEVVSKATKMAMESLRKAHNEGPSTILSNELKKFGNKLSISENEIVQLKEEYINVQSKGYNVFSATKKKLRYDYLKSFIEGNIEDSDRRAEEISTKLREELALFEMKEPDLHISKSLIRYGSRDPRRVSLGARIVVDAMLKGLAAETCGVGIVILDNVCLVGDFYLNLIPSMFVRLYKTSVNTIMMSSYNEGSIRMTRLSDSNRKDSVIVL